MNYSCEAFMNFCDEMMIDDVAEEGLGTKIKIGVKNAIIKLITILRRIGNQFKSYGLIAITDDHYKTCQKLDELITNNIQDLRNSKSDPNKISSIESELKSIESSKRYQEFLKSTKPEKLSRYKNTITESKNITYRIDVSLRYLRDAQILINNSENIHNEYERDNAKHLGSVFVFAYKMYINVYSKLLSLVIKKARSSDTIYDYIDDTVTYAEHDENLRM